MKQRVECGVDCCVVRVAGGSEVGADAPAAGPEVAVADEHKVGSGPGDRDVPQVALVFHPSDAGRGHRGAGDHAQHDRVAFATLEGVGGADPDPGLVAPPAGQTLGLGRVGGDDPDGRLVRQVPQQVLHTLVGLDGLGVVDPGPAGCGSEPPGGAAGDRCPVDGHRPVETVLGADVGEDGELAAIEQLVGDAGDVGVTPVVLVEQQAAPGDVLGGSESRMPAVGQPVLLQPVGADPGTPARGGLLGGIDARDMGQLHGVADDQCSSGPEQQRQDLGNGALAGLVNDDQVEQVRVRRELPHGQAGDPPAPDPGQQALGGAPAGVAVLLVAKPVVDEVPGGSGVVADDGVQ